MKVLFVVPYPTEGASNRYRIEQYLPYLKAEGIDYDVRPFAFKKFYEILYSKGKYIRKTIYFIQAFFNRILDIARLYKYNLVFIHRESCPFGPPIFEWLIYLFKKPIIFDFDDAIFLKSFHPVNSIYRFLKFPSNAKKIIKMSSAIIVANRFLEEYASKFNGRVYIIPTAIDTEKFNIIERFYNPLAIGWIGSPTAAPYLQIIYGVMEKLSQKYDFILKIVGAGKEIKTSGVKVENYNWRLEKEISDFQSIDIGIYPLPDTLWTQGKAAFKAIQYMAVGVPVVASPVGMTKEIIQDGINGFLADSEEKWLEKLSLLIKSPQLRESIGMAGRRTVEEKFSLKTNAPKYIEILKNV